MQAHAQFKIFLAAVLIALATLTIVTAPAQVKGGGQSKSPAVVVLPQDAIEAEQPLDPAVVRTGSAEGLHTRRHDAVMTPNDSFSFLPPVAYDSGGYTASFVAVGD